MIMHDINTLKTSYEGDWRAVLEFLRGILLKDSVKQVNITRTKDTWKVQVEGLKQGTKPKGSGKGLYDLYW